MNNQDDKDAILALHRDWWIANYDLDVTLMKDVFPAGEGSLLVHNNNGHPYFGREELIQLWEWSGRKLQSKSDTIIWRIEVSGDLGYAVGEATYHLPDREPTVIRFTEIYRREDGDGNPVWKMWYFHCSTASDFDAPRPPFLDSYNERGVGQVPTGDSFSVLSDWTTS
jgi:ketosteroid isomerase-like protein